MNQKKKEKKGIPAIVTNETLVPKWGDLKTFHHSPIEFLFSITHNINKYMIDTYVDIKLEIQKKMTYQPEEEPLCLEASVLFAL